MPSLPAQSKSSKPNEAHAQNYLDERLPLFLQTNPRSYQTVMRLSGLFGDAGWPVWDGVRVKGTFLGGLAGVLEMGWSVNAVRVS